MLPWLILAPVVASGSAFTCTPVAVWDGDGPILCAEGPKIRLLGIAAREIDGTCRPGQPCPTVSGIAARDQLVELLGGPVGTLPTGHIRVAAPVMTCRSYGNGKGDRTAATCTLPGTGDLGCALLASGVVLRWTRYPAADCNDEGGTANATPTSDAQASARLSAPAGSYVPRVRSAARSFGTRVTTSARRLRAQTFTLGRQTGAAISYFANCSMARAAGRAPIRVGQPGYSRKLDRDGDGIACE